ncbi:MAG: glycosyltransferase family 39 protein [Phycisphaerae bacterium]|nr:glycosyltransferase family 39 protein [Phycisphaerae bacterium]
MTNSRPDKSIAAPSRRRFLLFIGTIFLLALSVRLSVFLEVRNNPLYAFLTLDERGNHEFARAILDGRVPTASYYKAPLYTYFLAGAYAILGERPTSARLVQCILAALSPVLTALIARRLFGPAVGWIAGIWAAVFWTFVFFSSELLDTALACVFYLLLACILVAWDDRRWAKWPVAGAVLGLGAVTRPNILAFAPVLAFTVLVVASRPDRHDLHPPDRSRRRPLIRALTYAVLLTFGCCLTVLPVTLRNRIVGGEWVLLGAYGGLNVHVANNPDSDSKDGPLLVDESVFLETTTWDPNEPWADCCLNFKNAYRYAEAKLGRPPKRGEFGEILSNEGFRYIREHPTWFATHALRRFCWLFNAYEFPSNKDLYHFLRFSRVLTVLSYFHYGWLAPLALVGLGLAVTNRSVWSPGLAYLVAMLAALALPAVLFIINSRFRLPMVHLLVIFAAYGLVELVRMFRERTSRRRLLVASVALAILAAFCNLDLFHYRKEHQPYLRFAYAVACLKAERDDLLASAVADFERDLDADLAELTRQGRRSNTTLLLDHCTPMRLLLHYYSKKGNREKALQAAKHMLDRGEVDGFLAVQVFDLCDAVGDKERSAAALSILQRDAHALPQDLVAERLSRYGLRWSDAASLDQARKIYDHLSRMHPGNAEYHRRVEEIRRASAALPRSP